MRKIVQILLCASFTVYIILSWRSREIKIRSPQLHQFATQTVVSNVYSENTLYKRGITITTHDAYR
ncbi:hypothetical protein C0J52_21295 [Blattella germanica]|nr:hypothetical protein C0J52_21295 [Blattella germanica]